MYVGCTGKYYIIGSNEESDVEIDEIGNKWGDFDGIGGTTTN